MKPKLSATSIDDAEQLVAIRIAAMQESLLRIGRFDPARARDRFLSGFRPEQCWFIHVGDQAAGFLSLDLEGDPLLLQHLYLLPAFQNQGLGSMLMKMICAEADRRALPIKVGALRESDSNRFYLHHQFEQVSEEEWDIYYIRTPRPATGSVHPLFGTDK
jgi:GNAT superfamily N-acetyltransferase